MMRPDQEYYENEIYTGISISIIYTIAIVYAVTTASPEWMDGVSYFSAALAIASAMLWAMPVHTTLAMDGGLLVRLFRICLLFIQVAVLASAGMFITALIRIATEINALIRFQSADRQMNAAWQYEIAVDANGNPYIHCFKCGRRSFNKNDIAQRFCAHCGINHDSSHVS